MTGKYNPYLLLILFVIVFDSCSMQKRRYRQGFYINNGEKDQVRNGKDSNVSYYKDSSKINSLSLNKNSVHKHNCDTLLLKDGTTLLCRIEEVSKRSVRFKECKDSSQLTNSIDIDLVSLIKFYNGREKTISPKGASIKLNENKTLIKGNLVNKGLVLAILALLIECSLLLALFHVITMASYLIIALAVLNILTASVAVIFGFKSIREIRENPEVFKGKKMATWEIALGFLSLVSWLIILIAITI